jgi:hypothetical protein
MRSSGQRICLYSGVRVSVSWRGCPPAASTTET